VSWLEVVEPGPLTTIQDAGRPGLAHLGVSPAGFLDAPAARLANRLVGNAEDAALLESTGRGPTLRVPEGAASVVVAVTGAAAPVRIDGHAADPNAALIVRTGQTVSVGPATRGVRSYLAVRGGISVDAVLGSRSTDLLSGLGPPPLTAGQQLPYGRATMPLPTPDAVPVRAIDRAPTLHIDFGPRDDWFSPDTLARLTATAWTVSPSSSRVGVRLTGARLLRVREQELPPEGLVTGAIQVPPDGQPVLLLNDHPTTGGYPAIAVVHASDLAHAAQAAPGTSLRFTLARGGRASSPTTWSPR
jgi:biotin-dependent carboxylase-like uncharacterized protein